MPQSEARVRNAAECLHSAGIYHGWAGAHFKISFSEFEKADPIGFSEWLDLTARVLDAADAAC